VRTGPLQTRTYVRDDRSAGEKTAPGVWFAYSPDHRGEHPREHLTDFTGTFSSTRRNTRRLRRATEVPSMRPILGRRSSTVQMGTPDAYSSPPSSQNQAHGRAQNARSAAGTETRSIGTVGITLNSYSLLTTFDQISPNASGFFNSRLGNADWWQLSFPRRKQRRCSNKSRVIRHFVFLAPLGDGVQTGVIRHSVLLGTQNDNHVCSRLDPGF
jgi:hypothetical protein